MEPLSKKRAVAMDKALVQSRHVRTRMSWHLLRSSLLIAMALLLVCVFEIAKE